ncbi:MAG: hypothetical protein EOO15_01160 [Chitinophagaceae bacterium]|nr:MAG: hypothetical protein EOO15_01160 [Chitinophagaceae bacterium]
MKLLLTAAALLAATTGHAQPPALQDMVGAENRFAGQSATSNTRDAFFAFMDTSAIMFSKGAFGKSYSEWQAKEKRPGILHWKPLVAEMSAAGTWGFSTGPWTFRASEKDSVSARGHFFTIWQQTPEKQWKFIFDCGTDGGEEPLQVLYPFQAAKLRGTEAALVIVDSAFNELLRSNARAAHNSFTSATSVLCRNGQPYALTPGQQQKWIKGLPARIDALPAGRLFSPSGDMALVYGTTRGEKGEPEPFVRLWRHEPGGWKLAVELLRL